MTLFTSNIRTWTAVLCLAAVFLLAKYGGTPVSESYYATGQPGIASFVLGDRQVSSEGFFIGSAENRFWGPLAILASGLAFLLLSFRFLKESLGWMFAAAVFLYFILTRWEVMFYPPYGDTVSGPLAEAVWLLRNGFDYVKLAAQPGIVEGGPKIYLISAYPTFQALLMKFLPGNDAFVFVNHVLTFLLAAGTVAVFRAVVRQVYSDDVALTMSILLLSLPLFQSMAEQINMEMPLVFYSMLAMYFCSRKNIFAAAICSMIAAMVKGVGILICGVVAAYAVLLFLFDESHKFRFKTLLWGLVTAGFVALQMYAAFFILNEKGSVPMVGMFQGWKENSKLPVTPLFFLSAAIFFGIFLYEAFLRKKSIREFLEKYQVPFLMFTAGLAWFALFLQSYGAQYRYRLLLAPFSTFCVLFVVFTLVRKERIRTGILTGLIVVSLTGSYGAWMTPKNGAGSNHSAMERSLEYRNDLKVHIRTARFLETNFADFLIGAPFTIAHALAFPELGFVDKTLSVMLYGYPILYGGIKNFDGLKELNLSKTVWVGFEAGLHPELMKVIGHYPFGPEDVVLNNFQLGNRFLNVFLGGGYVERSRILKQMIAERQMREQIDRLRSIGSR